MGGITFKLGFRFFQNIILIKALFFVLLFLLFSFKTVAQTLIKVENNPYQNLGKKIAFWEDKSKSLSFDEVESLPDSSFHTGKNDIFNGGTFGKVWWMKLRYTNDYDTKVYLVLDYGNIDHLDIYYRDTLDKVGHIRSGTFSSSASRAFVATEYIFQLPEEIRGSTREIYVRLQTMNTLLVPVKLVDGLVLAKALHNKYVWQIIYIGIAISLFLFNFVMLLITKDRLYGLYIIRIFTLFYVYVLAYLNGYAHFFSDLVSQRILIHAQGVAAVGFIATIYLNRRFLGLKKHMPQSIMFFNLLTLLWLGILVLSLWDNREFTNKASQVLFFLSSVAFLYTSIRSIRRMRGAKDLFIICYVLGWIPICLSTVYVVFALINILPFEDYTLKVLTGAGILEATLISLALLGDRVRLLRKGKEEAEQMSIRLIRERNAFLEQKIDERTKELQLVNDQLKESNGFKDKLFSIIAHDMRSPISSLKGVLQLVDRDMLDTEQLNDFLVRIRKNTEQVQKTMDNLLNWSISQMGMQRYQPEVIEIKSFLLDHLAIYETLAVNKEIRTLVYCPEDAKVFADRNQLSLIVRNLIDNAIKFTPRLGAIKIDLKLLSNFAHVCIANSGKPISADTIAKILGNDKNILSNSYGTAEEKGTGLGLQLCKEFIGNMNSELKIESSEEGKELSVVFSFGIPLQVSPPMNDT